MKIRNGFVSNSSSSSFAIFGTEIGEEELNGFRDAADVDGIDVESMFDEVGLEFYSLDGYGAAIGISIETLWRQLPQELRDRATDDIRSKLEQILKRPVRVEFVSGEYPT